MVEERLGQRSQVLLSLVNEILVPKLEFVVSFLISIELKRNGMKKINRIQMQGS